MTSQTHYIYIILSKTNTLLGKLIRNRLGVSFNHCSISTDKSLNQLYSFGRRKLHNIFRAGFVTESKNYGFFKTYDDTQIAVLEIPVSNETMKRMEQLIAIFQGNAAQMKYSILGLIYCYIGISVHRKNKYFCAQFVAELLQKSGAENLNKSPAVTRPHDFLELPDAECVYFGKIKNYPQEVLNYVF